MDQAALVVADESAGGRRAHGEVTLVPVPVEHLPRVYALLAELMRPPADAGQHDSSPPLAAASQPGKPLWSSRLHYIVLARRPMNGATRAMLDLCAQRPGERVAFAEVAKASGLAPSVARGQLSGFTRTLKREFRQWDIRDWHDWPVKVEWGSSGDAFYRMSPEQAEWWRDATADR